MNYQTLYNNIIDNRIKNTYNGYTEKHHIIPRSLGGTDEQDNLVDLTAREHFICHYLLAKMYPKESFEWYKMTLAFKMMKCSSMNNKRYFNSRLYEALRINFSLIMSKSQKGKNNSQYGKMWVCNVELKENKKINKLDPIPEGWIKGRNKWNVSPKRTREEINKSISNSLQGRKRSLKTKQKISTTLKGQESKIKGKKFYYDPQSVASGVFMYGCEPEGWMQGFRNKNAGL